MAGWQRLQNILDGNTSCQLCEGFGWTLIPGKRSIRRLAMVLWLFMLATRGPRWRQTCAHCDGTGKEPR